MPTATTGGRASHEPLPERARSPLSMRRWILPMVMLAAALSAGACSRQHGSDDGATQAPLVDTVTWGPIRLELTLTPGTVRLDRDVLLDIRVEAPELTQVTIPPLEDRLQGFAHSGRFESEPDSTEGRTVRDVHIRLTPLVADEYRVAPFAVSFKDTSTTPAVTGAFPTRAINVPFTPPAKGGGDLTGDPEPLWIRPPARTIAAYAAAVIGLLAVLFGLWKLFTRVREEIIVRRLSPRERALRELSQLLAKGLIARGLVKDFYIELTMVVRRYIERRHAVRAPEQTTEEFLAAVGEDARFKPEVLRRLRDFLQAADRVKFAAHRPAPADIESATDTARGYIEHDDAEATAADGTKERT